MNSQRICAIFLTIAFCFAALGPQGGMAMGQGMSAVSHVQSDCGDCGAAVSHHSGQHCQAGCSMTVALLPVMAGGTPRQTALVCGYEIRQDWQGHAMAPPTGPPKTLF